MKFSQLFIPTTKEKPKEASLISHQYLIRGGFISQVGAGIYTYLPLGKMVLDTITRIVKEEMNKAGANEVQFGFVTPLGLWDESGRSSTMGEELLRFKDRKNGQYVLSPTNEESVVDLVRHTVKSYKDLPLNLYQVYTKFRDEARPRFGLMRGREFLMKDAYSFHSSYDDLLREFTRMQSTYETIYQRLGLDFRVVEADSGAIGGNGSKEFMVLADSGEDTIVVCSHCDYAANIEAAKRKKETSSFNHSTQPLNEKIHTPNITTIEAVSSFFNTTPKHCIKAVIKRAIYEDRESMVVFFIRGSDELEPTKAVNAIKALELIDPTKEQLEESSIISGYCGPFNLTPDTLCVIDQELENEKDLIAGANEVNYHYTSVDLSQLDQTTTRYADLITVQEGDKCPQCGNPLKHTKGIEAGHIFQLGTKYSNAMKAHFLNEQGKAEPFIMGCYGIGVSRLIAATVEQHHDERGVIWPKEITPFMVMIIVSNAKKEEQSIQGEKLHTLLNENNISTLLDDRKKERFGFKMKDYELLGFPYAVIIGDKLQDNLIEIVNRQTLHKETIPLNNVLEELKQRINS